MKKVGFQFVSSTSTQFHIQIEFTELYNLEKFLKKFVEGVLENENGFDA